MRSVLKCKGDWLFLFPKCIPVPQDINPHPFFSSKTSSFPCLLSLTLVADDGTASELFSSLSQKQSYSILILGGVVHFWMNVQVQVFQLLRLKKKSYLKEKKKLSNILYGFHDSPKLSDAHFSRKCKKYNPSNHTKTRIFQFFPQYKSKLEKKWKDSIFYFYFLLKNFIHDISTHQDFWANLCLLTVN